MTARAIEKSLQGRKFEGYIIHCKLFALPGFYCTPIRIFTAPWHNVIDWV